MSKKRLPRALREDLFWSRVDRSAGPDGCWPWKGGHFSDGYGSFQVGAAARRTHRIVYELAIGPIPAGLQVLHDCDNPPCCNPTHFFLGTNADNMADKVAKGRQARGEKQGLAKLTADDVRCMRSLRGEGALYTDLAALFGVDPSNVGYICLRKTWKHI